MIFCDAGAHEFSPAKIVILPAGIPFLIDPEQILFNAMQPVEIQYEGSPYFDSMIELDPILSRYLFKKLLMLDAIVCSFFMSLCCLEEQLLPAASRACILYLKSVFLLINKF